MALGRFERAVAARALGDTSFDVLVIGAGVTGAGVALDAASRGLRTALVERDDFASGTSSRSSKLVHGGLRYLQNGETSLVREALRERQRLLRNAPHLVRPLPFLIPVTGRDGVVDPRIARALGSAMWGYDLAGGWRVGHLHRRLGADATHDHMPTLERERLRSGYLYWDATADDARLTLSLARTAAVDHGAVALNHARAVGLLHDRSGRARGALVVVDGDEIEVRSAVVVNAAGVWADEIRALDEGAHPAMLRPAKGVHVTVPWSLVRNDIAVVVPVPGDRRSVFVVPWLPTGDGGFALTYVGTTDTAYDGPLDEPRCEAADVEYLLGALNRALGARGGAPGVTASDVTGAWAGLRPLLAAEAGRTADLSRRHTVSRSPAGVITVTGGKLTTYRAMAQATVDAVLDVAGAEVSRRARRCGTARLALRGAAGWEAARDRDAHLGGRYGGEADAVEALVAADPRLGEPLVAGLPYRRAEAVHAVRHEMARDLDDVLARRTRARLQDRAATAAAADDVAALIGPALGWDASRAEHEADLYRRALADDVPAAVG